MNKGILNWIVSNEKIFFKLLAEQSAIVLEGAKFLNKTISRKNILAKDIAVMHSIEQKGDHARHAVVNKLNESFITPFDREDIFLVSGSLDDILDDIDGVMHRFKTYHKPKPSKECFELSKILLESVIEVDKAVVSLQKSDEHFTVHLRKISELEEKADNYYRQALEKLFLKKDAKEIIVEKDLIEFMEMAIDTCKQAAIEMEGIILKSS